MSSKKVLVIGAGGHTGRCLVSYGVEYGHQITAFVRSRERLEAAVGLDLLTRVEVVEGDALDAEAVGRAMAGKQAAVNAAQHPDDAAIFEAICRNVVQEAEKHLLAPGRLWLFGGLPGLDVPHTKIIGSDLPGMRPVLRSHKVNYELLKSSDLDWSFMCPGPMYFAARPSPVEALRVVTEIMPFQTAPWTRWLPKIFHSLNIMRHLDEVTISYQDVARFVMSDLAGNGPYSRKRVGLQRRRD